MPIDSVIGRLHDKKVISRFKEAGLPDFLLTMLEHGVSLEIKNKSRMLRKCVRVANSSSLASPGEVVTIIHDWLDRGFIEEISKKDMIVCHPLTLNHRYVHEDGSYKPRLCLDLSAFNEFVETPYVKFPHLEYLGPKIRKNQFLALIDMKDY